MPDGRCLESRAISPMVNAKKTKVVVSNLKGVAEGSTASWQLLGLSILLAIISSETRYPCLTHYISSSETSYNWLWEIVNMKN